MKFSIIPVLIFSLLIPLHAQEREYLDSVIAIVEDDVITNYQLFGEIKRLREEFSRQGRNLPNDAALNRQVLELMISKSILQQQAENRGIKITDTQLNNAMQNMARQNKLSLEGFRRALLARGMDYRQFREDIRKELAIKRLQSGYAASNAEVSDQEVDDFLQRNSSPQSLEYRLSHILVSLPDGANSEQVAQAHQRIDAILQELDDGADFSSVASARSDGPNALEGGDLGWRKPAEIPSLFSEVIPSLKIGAVSAPIRSASGLHLVRLSDKRDSEQVLTRQTHARHILIKTDELITDAMAQEKLTAIRERIVQGEDFAELAKRYSDDAGSRGLGGDLDWFDDGTMVAEFTDMLKQVNIGETSPVFQSQFGWHILQLLGTRTVDETEESRRKKIRAQLLEQKRQEVLELWRKRLRDRAFVKIFDT